MAGPGRVDPVWQRAMACAARRKEAGTPMNTDAAGMRAVAAWVEGGCGVCLTGGLEGGCGVCLTGPPQEKRPADRS